MAGLKLDISHIYPFVPEDTIRGYKDLVHMQQSKLLERRGEGSDFLGWLDLPSAVTEDLVRDLEEIAGALRKMAEIIVVVGIGGSYLGAKSMISALSQHFNQYAAERKGPDVIFAGQNIGEDYLSELIEVLDNRSYALIVISKSGTTTEPAIAFRILKNHLEQKVGHQEAADRIITITDEKSGALRKLTDQSGYRSFTIPDDVGGRYSVLTPVGLLPIACAGFNIREFIRGAAVMKERTGLDTPFLENPAALYAAARNALYSHGRTIEILASYTEKLIFFAEWWKQLFGESEGKQHKGIFPASVNFTADLHSMGQYIQEGERILFETLISVIEPDRYLAIPDEAGNLDQLNYLAGKRVSEVNRMAELGTLLAHVDGGVPNMRIEIPAINEYHLGELVYFFEMACGISGYLLEVNPFNQPGVEAYKKNMFALLEKPGFEEETMAIQKRLGK